MEHIGSTCRTQSGAGVSAAFRGRALVKRSPVRAKTWCDGSIISMFLEHMIYSYTSTLWRCVCVCKSEGVKERVIVVQWKTLFCKKCFQLPIGRGLIWFSPEAALTLSFGCMHSLPGPSATLWRARLLPLSFEAAARRGPGGVREGEACLQTHTLSRTNHHPGPVVPANGETVPQPSPCYIEDLVFVAK